MKRNGEEVEFPCRQMSIWSLGGTKISPQEPQSRTISAFKSDAERTDTKLNRVDRTKSESALKCPWSRPLAMALVQGLVLGIISTIWALILVIVLWTNAKKQTSTSNMENSTSSISDAIDIPVSLGNSTTTVSTSNCLFSLTPFRAATLASWPLDGSLSDLNNVYTAQYTSSPTVPYVTGNIGQAVSFSGSNYIYSNTKFLNLSYRSWTIEA